MSDADRRNGAIGVLICGPTGRLFQPVVVSAPPADVAPEDYRRVFDAMGHAMGRLDDGTPGMLVALARPGSRHVTPQDERWFQAAVESCADHEVDLLGVWLVTPDVIRPLPPEASARRSA
jgi:hypothetical protein